MREHLFRGQRDDKKWFYGDLIQYEDGICSISYYHGIDRCLSIVDPDTVGEYTGLTDKNGKRIFEDDLIKTKFFGREDRKHWCNWGDYDTFRIVYDNDGYKMVGNSGRWFPCVYIAENTQRFEICGNIHDNPELLKGAEE